ncbi:MAG: preprotein translocase subunit SecA [Eubacteriales bacterium]|nr:preprotein translocase subunit SecA [Eubacteriales bacterium]
MFKIFEKIFGNYSEKEVKRIMPIADKIESLEPEMEKLTDEQLKAKTPEFKKRLSQGEALDDILPEAFAVVREASKRVLGMRHFRVQLIGGIVLHQGRISEMKTGEGKTLVATLPVYLNSLEGKGVHVVTVNDYLAKRDSEWMGKIYNFLGLSVGLIVHDLDNTQRRSAYACDVTYGTNNEFGFDYLRDNMVIYKQDMVQRDLYYAIVDEVDSILVDEARTPLIISGMGSKSTQLYELANSFVRGLKSRMFVQVDEKEYDDEQQNLDVDYIIDEKAHSATLTKPGVEKVERFFNIQNLSDPDNLTISHHVNQALKAHGLMKRDRDYVVKDGEVIIVDEFTGRLMYGRRYSDGLHQAIEAKEGVKVERESKTLATITFQNYFRMYKKLAGMTGTAQTEEEEFRTIYGMDVVVIPTNMPMIREDKPDSVYKTEAAKFRAVINEILECHEKGQPALIGTISIEKSELLSSLLRKRGIKHNVLNAKFHDKEAEIIAQAGKYGAVTIATNMAGRGTDIVLGGNAEFQTVQDMKKKGFPDEIITQANGFNETDNEEVLEARKEYRALFEKIKADNSAEKDKVIDAGGLHIIGTERHESRRIDNQLRGRSGRQGDPGSSRFYISFEDDLMRLFGTDRVLGLINALGMEEDQPIEHKMLTNAIENAQKRVEGKNFDIRKHVLQYDDVMNKQREVIYGQRRKVLDGENLKEYFLSMIRESATNLVDMFTGESEHPDYWDWGAMTEQARLTFIPAGMVLAKKEEFNDITKNDIKERIIEEAIKKYESKEQEVSSDIMRELERVVLLRVVDEKWMDHIDAMDQLRHGIGLRAYGQRDPVIEYKFEGYEMFEEMIRNIREDAVRIILNYKIAEKNPPKREKVAEPVNATHGNDVRKPVSRGDKVGRNDPCPCGSGKKYKHCCGRNTGGGNVK